MKDGQLEVAREVIVENLEQRVQNSAGSMDISICIGSLRAAKESLMRAFNDKSFSPQEIMSFKKAIENVTAAIDALTNL